MLPEFFAIRTVFDLCSALDILGRGKAALGQLLPNKRYHGVKKSYLEALKEVASSKEINSTIRNDCKKLMERIKDDDKGVIRDFLEVLVEYWRYDEKHILWKLITKDTRKPVIDEEQLTLANKIFLKKLDKELGKNLKADSLALQIESVHHSKQLEEIKFISEETRTKVEEIISSKLPKNKLANFIDAFQNYQKSVRESIRVNLSWILDSPPQNNPKMSQIWTDLYFEPIFLPEIYQNSEDTLAHDIQESSTDFEISNSHLEKRKAKKLQIDRINKFILGENWRKSDDSLTPNISSEIDDQFKDIAFDRRTRKELSKKFGIKDEEIRKLKELLCVKKKTSQWVQDLTGIFGTILVFGIAGSGKSTFLRHLEDELLSKNREEGILPILPIYIRLYDFSQKLIEDSTYFLSQYIIDHLRGTSEGKFGSDVTLDDLCSCFDVWLLIDAVDEIKYLQEEKACQRLEMLLKDHPFSKIIITSRRTNKMCPEIRKYPTLEIADLIPTQISEYLLKFFSLIDKKGDPELQVAKFLADLKDSKLSSVLNTYFNVTLFTLPYEDGYSKADEITKFWVMNEAVEYLLHKWDKELERFGIVKGDFDIDKLRNIVAKVACKTFAEKHKANLSFSVPDVRKAYREEFEHFDRPEIRKISQDLVDYLKERAGFRPIEKEKSDLPAFQHRLVRDFFAMIYLRGSIERSKEFLKNSYKDEMKLSVIPFLIANFCFHKQKEDAKVLIKNIIENIQSFKEPITFFNEIADLGVDLDDLLEKDDLLKYLQIFPEDFFTDLEGTATNLRSHGSLSPILEVLFSAPWMSMRKQCSSSLERKTVSLNLFRLFWLVSSQFGHLPSDNSEMAKFFKKDLKYNVEKQELTISGRTELESKTLSFLMNKQLPLCANSLKITFKNLAALEAFHSSTQIFINNYIFHFDFCLKQGKIMTFYGRMDYLSPFLIKTVLDFFQSKKHQLEDKIFFLQKFLSHQHHNSIFSFLPKNKTVEKSWYTEFAPRINRLNSVEASSFGRDLFSMIELYDHFQLNNYSEWKDGKDIYIHEVLKILIRSTNVEPLRTFYRITQNAGRYSKNLIAKNS